MAAVTGPRITPNSFFATTAPPAGQPRKAESSPVTIYFISGNPGLIGYYHTFLSLLSSYLSSSSSSSPSAAQDKNSVSDSFHIYGSSLGGFEVGAESSNEKKKKEQPELYGLEQQIHLAESRLEAFVSANCPQPASTTVTTGNVQNRPRVILMGHSVGAYIAMEILRRHREEFSHAPFDIVGGIMLFPTVVDIALSPEGKRLTVGCDLLSTHLL